MADHHVDVLVVGSGAGALTAALAAHEASCSVAVIEKSGLVGGASAMSGGAIWIPGSPHAAAAGTPDSPDDARRYLRALASPEADPAAIDAFVDNAGPMLRWLEQTTTITATLAPYPDFHPALPGASPGLRTHQIPDLDGRELGASLQWLRPSAATVTLLGHIAMSAMESGLLLIRPPGWRKVLARILWRYYGDWRQRLRSRRDSYLSFGNALVGRLLLALQARDIAVWRNAGLIGLRRTEGRVDRAVVERNGAKTEIVARCGIILAAGGFEHDDVLRGLHLPASPDGATSATPPSNRGDALRAAVEMGAATRDMGRAWWAATIRRPGAASGYFCAMEPNLPGIAVIDSQGRRFGTEAGSYHDFAAAMVERLEAFPGERFFLLFGREARHAWPIGGLVPFVPDWLQPRALTQVRRAATLPMLGLAAGIAPEGLAATVADWNEAVAAGKAKTKLPGLKPLPIARAPFYAMEIHPGDLGTCGGLCTNADAAVVDTVGAPIEGLYAIGNTAASLAPRSLPALGAILGPAMTFGYLAARHAARRKTGDRRQTISGSPPAG